MSLLRGRDPLYAASAQEAGIMPGTAHAAQPTRLPAETSYLGDTLAPADFAYLLHLQRQALHYFLDNQFSHGLMLDRQHNHGPLRSHGWCSTATTGMGMIALAVASMPPHQLLTPSAAATRIAAGLLTALEKLPHDRGIVPHFVDSASHMVCGDDHLSTVDSAWLVAGALTAGALLQDAQVQALAEQLYERIDWAHWTAPDVIDFQGLLRHGKGPDGQFLPCSWDRLNGETVFMYVLAAGAEDERAIPGNPWLMLRPCYGTVAGMRFCSADLGLFVFQYGLDLLDLRRWRAPGEIDLAAEARLATEANLRFCRELACHFATYRRHWGLSAGDGPGNAPALDTYRCYAPSGPVDGTAHLTATLGAIAHRPDAVLENLRNAETDRATTARGRYGFSNVNDRWVGRDMVGIDAGAAMLALDNFLFQDRVRSAFHSLPSVQRGLKRMGFVPIECTSTNLEALKTSERQAS
jgi:hypothetical protein